MSLAFNDNSLSDRLDRYKLLLLNDDFWVVFAETLSESDIDDEGRNKNAMQDNGIDYINYYVKASEAISICYAESEHAILNETKIDNAKQIIDCCMDTFHRYGNFPRPKYKNLDYGWVSSMDAPVIALASEMIYELSGDITYQNYCLELLPYMVKTTEEGGYNLRSNNWPLEYAWKTVDHNSAWYVLNGSLVGYTATKALSEIYSYPWLEEYLHKVEVAYTDMAKEFHKGDSWTYYMLNVKGVIPIHYMIFEEKLFNAASMLSDNQVFSQEYTFRSQCLENVLEVQFFETEEGYEYDMLRATSPNYYQIDTYSTKIEFIDLAGNCIYSEIINESGSMQERKDVFYNTMFHHGYLKELPARYVVYSVNKGILFKLFESEVTLTQKVDDVVDYTTDIAYDARFIDNDMEEVILVKEDHIKEEGDISFSLEKSIFTDNSKSWCAIEIDNLNDTPVHIGLILYNSNGNATTRYYTPLSPGKNCIVLDSRGFVDSESLGDISSIWLRLYDDDLNNKASFALGDFRLFSDLKSYYDYVHSSDHLINPQ